VRPLDASSAPSSRSGPTSAAVVDRFRASTGVERQQLKWFAYAALIPLIIFGATTPLELGWIGSPLCGPLSNALFEVAVAGFPIAIGIAILRHTLYDIDLLINRTLVYTALTGCVVGIYVLVVGYLGVLFQTGGHTVISLLTTGLVAVLSQLLRERLQRGVNRLVYRQRRCALSERSPAVKRSSARPSPGD